MAFQVGPDTVVHFSYSLSDADGELCEASEEELSFLFGYGQLAPVLEAAFDGLFPGEERVLTLEPEAAFGPRDEQAVVEFDRADFGPDVRPGDEFVVDHDSGDVSALTVLDVFDDRVVVDTNHPLAGQRVSLRVRVEAVRPATSVELSLAAEELESQERAFPSLLPSARLVRRPSEQP